MSKIIKRGQGVGPSVIPAGATPSNAVSGIASEDAGEVPDLLEATRPVFRPHTPAVPGEAAPEPLEQAVALMIQAEAYHARVIGDLRQEIVRLAVEIARKVLHAEIETSSQIVARLAADLLARSRLGRSVVVRVHPLDLRATEEARPALLAAAGRAEGFILRADSSVARGGCIVESELGTLDAQLESQLLEIEKVLLEGPG